MKKVLLAVILIILALSFWGCNHKAKETSAKEVKTKSQELTKPQQLAVDFLFQLVKNYGAPSYNIKVYDVKVYTPDNKWYYISADAEIAGVSNGERRRFGNDVAFLLGENIRFITKESSAYKFLTESNQASEKGKSLELGGITAKLSAMLKDQKEAYRAAKK